MPRPSSFYLPPGQWLPPYILTGAEASHLSKALRIREGETVRLFDGLGRQGLFTVMIAGKNKTELAPIAITEAPAPASEAILALGWNKSSRRGWLLEKAAELQASEIIFWKAQRSQGEVPDAPKDSWRDALIAGAKQSGAPRLPRLAVMPGGPDGLLADPSQYAGRYLLWEEPGATRLCAENLARPGKHLFAAGPEGGLTDREARLFLDAGFVPASLGQGVLRWETAALVTLGLAFWARPDTADAADAADATDAKAVS